MLWISNENIYDELDGYFVMHPSWEKEMLDNGVITKDEDGKFWVNYMKNTSEERNLEVRMINKTRGSGVK